ncbi:MAG: peptidase M75 [Bacteroidales bacterium]|nr:peptidase M75 [Bacteroidales bacterium]
MKNYLKKVLNTLFVIALVAGAASCKKDKVTTDDEAEMTAIAEQYVNHTVVPTYKNLATYTDQLATQIQTLKSAKTQDNLNQVCETFLQARAWWEKSEAFLFGAAGDYGIDPHIDSWPLDEDAFNIMMANDAQINAMNSEDGDSYAGEVLGNALLGFHGIEYILFSNGQPKTVANISDKELIYAAAVAGDLRNRCFQLEVAWAGEDNAPAAHVAKLDDLELAYTVSGGALSYGENMVKAGQPGSHYTSMVHAMMEILDGCAAIADEVGTSKIGKPYSDEDASYIESPYSQTSTIDFYNNIKSIENAYYGGIEGQRDESKSLHKYIADRDSELDGKITSAITNALAKIDAMPKPFVNNRSDSRNGIALSACQALDEAMAEAKQKIAEL